MLESIMEGYGREVAVTRGEEAFRVRAFLQPMTSRMENMLQCHPGVLGLEDQDRFIYIGPLELEVRTGDELEADGKQYWMRACHVVYGTAEPVYIWGVCVRKGGEDQWAVNG